MLEDEEELECLDFGCSATFPSARLLIVAAFLLSAPLLARGADPAAPAATREIYESDRFRFSLRRPSDQWIWRIAANDASEGESKIGSLNGTTGFQLLAKLTRTLRPEDPAFVNVTIDCFPRTPGHEDPVESARSFTEAMRPGDENYSLLEAAKEVLVDGHRAAYTELEVTLKRPEADGSRAAYPAHVRAWFFPIEDYWVRLIISARREQWAAVEPELRKTSDSLKFLPPALPAQTLRPAKSGVEDVLEGLKF